MTYNILQNHTKSRSQKNMINMHSKHIWHVLPWKTHKTKVDLLVSTAHRPPDHLTGPPGIDLQRATKHRFLHGRERHQPCCWCFPQADLGGVRSIPKSWGYPKKRWMVYFMENPMKSGWFGATVFLFFLNHHLLIKKWLPGDLVMWCPGSFNEP